MIQMSHDAYARESVVRRTVSTEQTCAWCGHYRYHNGTELTIRDHKMFQYGTERDDRPGERNVNWHNGLFCSKSCHDSYHHL